MGLVKRGKQKLVDFIRVKFMPTVVQGFIYYIQSMNGFIRLFWGRLLFAILFLILIFMVLYLFKNDWYSTIMMNIDQMPLSSLDPSLVSLICATSGIVLNYMDKSTYNIRNENIVIWCFGRINIYLYRAIPWLLLMLSVVFNHDNIVSFIISSISFLLLLISLHLSILFSTHFLGYYELSFSLHRSLDYILEKIESNEINKCKEENELKNEKENENENKKAKAKNIDLYIAVDGRRKIIYNLFGAVSEKDITYGSYGLSCLTPEITLLNQFMVEASKSKIWKYNFEKTIFYEMEFDVLYLMTKNCINNEAFREDYFKFLLECSGNSTYTELCFDVRYKIGKNHQEDFKDMLLYFVPCFCVVNEMMYGCMEENCVIQFMESLVKFKEFDGGDSLYLKFKAILHILFAYYAKVTYRNIGSMVFRNLNITDIFLVPTEELRNYEISYMKMEDFGLLKFLRKLESLNCIYMNQSTSEEIFSSAVDLLCVIKEDDANIIHCFEKLMS